MLLLVGLGNPGAEHALNRHNIGFMALDTIVARYRFSPWRQRFQGEICEGIIAGEKVLALKPITFMNLSGQAVGEAARFFKIAPDQIIVIYDEIELPAGKLRVKQAGGSAGHNGLKSLDAHIGPDYWRIRLGVGRPDDKHRVRDYVLQNFAKVDVAWLGPLLDAVADAVPLLVGGDANKFMTKVALLTAPPKPDKPDKKPTTGNAPGSEQESS